MNLDPIDKIRINKFYQQRYQAYGDKNARSVDWDSQKNQLERFKLFEKIGDLNDKKILDFGSGLGDFYGFLKTRYKNFEYLGIDVVEDFIKVAKHKYPTGTFSKEEMGDLKQRFDYVFASGSLTFHVHEGEKFYFKVIRQMYDLCDKGVGFNMLDRDFYGIDDYDISMYLTYDKTEVLEYCKTFAKDVKIITEYIPGDFTVFLKK